MSVDPEWKQVRKKRVIFVLCEDGYNAVKNKNQNLPTVKQAVNHVSGYGYGAFL